MFDELADNFFEIMKEGHTGVLYAIADGCKRLSAKQGPFVNVRNLNFNVIKLLITSISEHYEMFQLFRT